MKRLHKFFSELTDFARLARPWQWYKNLVIFIPLVFSGQMHDFSLWLTFAIGFFVLCLVSSAAYAINDVADAAADRKHPQKKNRPVASGRITQTQALLFAVILLAATAIATYELHKPLFSLFSLALFASICAYSLFLKNIPIIDVNVIAADFALRALAGSFLFTTPISPWLVTIVYFLALLLASGRRYSELRTLGARAAQHKRVFAFYTKDKLDGMIKASATLVLLAYAAYSVLNPFGAKMVVTLPIVCFLVARYARFIYAGSEIASQTEKVFTDKPMIAGITAWLATSIALIYYL